MNFFKKVVYIFVCLTMPLLANENKEINIYTAYKYKVDYTKLSKEQQSKIDSEYKDLEKLTTNVYNKIKSTPLYSVQKNFAILQSWSSDFLNQYKPTEDELKVLYSQNNFQTNSKYKLKTLTLKDKKRAQSIMKQLEAKKNKNDRIRLFEIFVKKDSLDTTTKSRKGDLGWINESTLLPKIKQNISKLQINDILTLTTKDTIQIIYLEDTIKPQKATFEESKPLLIQIAKQQALQLEIQKLSK